MITIEPSHMSYSDADLLPYARAAIKDAIAYAGNNGLVGVILATYAPEQLVKPQEAAEDFSSLLPKAADDQIDVPVYVEAAAERDACLFSVPEKLRSGEEVVHLLLLVDGETSRLEIKDILRKSPADGRFDPVKRLEADRSKLGSAEAAEAAEAMCGSGAHA